MGSEDALKFVDDEAVQQLELRVPGLSRQDEEHVKAIIRNGQVFRRLQDESERSGIAARILQVRHLIPSVRTLQKDSKYLGMCTTIARLLVLGQDRPPRTIQAMALKAFQPDHDTLTNRELVFMSRLKRLYLLIMQNLIELSSGHSRRGDGQNHRGQPLYDQRAWSELAKRARDLGFVSMEISRLMSLNPDQEIALRALYDARKPPDFEYDSAIVDELVSTIMSTFSRAKRSGIARKPTPDFTTTSGPGEQIFRRCGRQDPRAYARDRWSLTWKFFSRPVEGGEDVTSLFVRRSVFHAFWGLEEDEDRAHEELLAPVEASSDKSGEVAACFRNLGCLGPHPKTISKAQPNITKGLRKKSGRAHRQLSGRTRKNHSPPSSRRKMKKTFLLKIQVV